MLYNIFIGVDKTRCCQANPSILCEGNYSQVDKFLDENRVRNTIVEDTHTCSSLRPISPSVKNNLITKKKLRSAQQQSRRRAALYLQSIAMLKHGNSFDLFLSFYCTAFITSLFFSSFRPKILSQN